MKWILIALLISKGEARFNELRFETEQQCTQVESQLHKMCEEPTKVGEMFRLDIGNCIVKSKCMELK